MLKTRFAPSPTGLLHLGNIYSALQCEAWAKTNKAQMILRIEDVDFHRCKSEFSQQIMDDLAWLGLCFDGELSFQQQRSHLYQDALDKLIAMDVLYPCFCTRKEIREAIKTATIIHTFLDSYPQTCLLLHQEEVASLKKEKPFSWRLNSQKVGQLIGEQQTWVNAAGEPQIFNVSDVGDVVIGRKDIQFSYHLAVVVDDEEQGITHVIRGEDLKDSTPVHCILQKLLGYTSPLYLHHDLLLGTTNEKLSKGRQSLTLKAFREDGLSPEKLRELVKNSLA